MQSIGDRVVLGEDESKKYNIASAVKASDLQLIKAFKEEPKKKEVYSGVPSNGSDEYKKKNTKYVDDIERRICPWLGTNETGKESVSATKE